VKSQSDWLSLTLLSVLSGCRLSRKFRKDILSYQIINQNHPYSINSDAYKAYMSTESNGEVFWSILAWLKSFFTRHTWIRLLESPELPSWQHLGMLWQHFHTKPASTVVCLASYLLHFCTAGPLSRNCPS
jgi:hypothetical protein